MPAARKQAVDELVRMIDAEGFRKELVQDIADRHGLRPLILNQWFEEQTGVLPVRYERLLAELGEGREESQADLLGAALREARRWASERFMTRDEILAFGRTFKWRDREYVYVRSEIPGFTATVKAVRLEDAVRKEILNEEAWPIIEVMRKPAHDACPHRAKHVDEMAASWVASYRAAIKEIGISAQRSGIDPHSDSRFGGIFNTDKYEYVYGYVDARRRYEKVATCLIASGSVVFFNDFWPNRAVPASEYLNGGFVDGCRDDAP